MDRFKSTVRLCILGCFIYVFQYFLPQKASYLLDLQSNFYYKVISGSILALYVLHQWQLAYTRMSSTKEKRSSKVANHIARSHWGIILLFLHAISFGYGFQIVLSVAFCLDIFLGAFAPQLVSKPSKVYSSIWVFTHVSLSVVVLVLMFYHVYIALIYSFT